jgi:hypothetical protein
VIVEGCDPVQEVSARHLGEVDVYCRGKVDDEQIDFPVSDLQGWEVYGRLRELRGGRMVEAARYRQLEVGTLVVAEALF